MRKQVANKALIEDSAFSTQNAFLGDWIAAHPTKDLKSGAELCQYVSEMLAAVAEKYVDIRRVERSVYYMNGNDGTKFDFNENHSLCEFQIFYDKAITGDTWGAIKLYVRDNDYGKSRGFDSKGKADFQIYYYLDDGKADSQLISAHNVFSHNQLITFYEYMFHEFDQKFIWDSVVYNF